MRSILSMVAAAAAVLLPVNDLALALAPPTGTSSNSRIRTRPSSSSPSPSSSSLSSRKMLMESTLERTPTTNDNNLSPFLRGMVDEQRELQMNVGKAMDVLQKDYPYFLRRAPDYSIYHDSISMKSSDGHVQLSTLSSYKKAFGITRTMLSLLYDVDRSVVQSRMVYDSPRTQIRVSFNAMLVPKLGLLNSLGGKTVHVDGISVYSIDLSSTLREDEVGNLSRNDGAGKVVEHRVERLLVNGLPLQPPYLNAFGLEMMSGQQAGALAGAGAWS